MQENVYLGEPYKMLKNHNAYIHQGVDPFSENGPHIMYPYAALLRITGSLTVQRFVQFSSSLISVMLLGFYFFQQRRDRLSLYESALYALLIVSTWLSIPLALSYPAQANGMMAGFVCFLLGLYYAENSPRVSMMLFGLAYACKTQYLGMLPGILAYKLFIESPEKLILHRIREMALQTVLYFVPAVLVIPAICASLGLFRNWPEFKDFALNGPHEIWVRAIDNIPGLFFGMSKGHQEFVGEVKAAEYAGYGLLTWLHILFSCGVCLYGAGLTVWQRLRGLKFNAAWGLLGFSGIIYWLHFFFIYRYPYWYNVFALIVLNAFFAPLVLERIIHSLGKRKLLPIAAICVLAFFVRTVWNLPGWKLKQPGTALVPYEWMN